MSAPYCTTHHKEAKGETQAKPAKKDRRKRKERKKRTHHLLPLGLPLLPLPAHDKHLDAKCKGERTHGHTAKVAAPALDGGEGVFGGLGACAGFWVGGLGYGGWLKVEA